MGERPIIFSTEMVRAILEGRKSMTRRVIKPQPRQGWEYQGFNVHEQALFYPPSSIDLADTATLERAYDEWDGLVKLPHAKGGLLYVKETWGGRRGTKGIVYRADNDDGGPWNPSMFMRKDDARLWLEVTDVMVQRVQMISGDDAIAEGCDGRKTTRQMSLFGADRAGRQEIYKIHAPFDYRILWDSLNAKNGHPWDANPWIAAYTFKRIQPAEAEGGER